MMSAQPRGTNGALLASLPWSIGALLLALIPHFPYLDIWITAAFAACAAWRYAIEKRRRLLPPRWLRGALAVMCFLGIFATYSTVSGVGPGSALLAIMAALKLLETRQRRDQYVLLFISIFLVMSSLLREQYLWSLPYLVVGILVILAAWLRLSSNASVATKQSFKTSSRLLLYAAPLALAMWIFFPRLSTPFWSLPMDTGKATSGISDEMSPGDISSLSLSDEVAFRVKFDGDMPKSSDLYWRGLVLSTYSGRSWKDTDNGFRGESKSGNAVFVGEAVAYEIDLEATRQNWAFALDIPGEIVLPNSTIDPKRRIILKFPIEQRIKYSAVSYIDYTLRPNLPGYFIERNTKIPQIGNERTIELALAMRASSTSDTAYIDAVLNKFYEEEYFYTLQPPALGNNSIDRFLFDSKQGFCEHYASAFAFMMRAVGIPARIVLGYQGGEVNPINDQLIVRQSDAHAWTEVWLEGYGWKRIDPTAAVAPERIEYGVQGATQQGFGAAWGFTASSDLMQNMTMARDALNAQWNDLILGYGPDKQTKLMLWLGMQDPSWSKMLWPLIGSVISLIMIISAVLMLRYRKPPKDAASVLYDRFVKKTGLAINVGETPQKFALRVVANSDLAQTSVDEVTSTYLDARYGPDDGDETTLTRLQSSVSVIPKARKAR